MLTKARIAEILDARDLKPIEYAPQPSKMVHIIAKCTHTEGNITIAVWPETTELDLNYLAARAAYELRGGGYGSNNQHEWLM